MRYTCWLPLYSRDHPQWAHLLPAAAAAAAAAVAKCVCVCVFSSIHSGHQVCWTYQPGSLVCDWVIAPEICRYFFFSSTEYSVCRI